MKIEVYYVARFKDGECLFATDGPFIEQVQAEIICNQQTGRRCYSEVVKVELPCEVVEYAR